MEDSTTKTEPKVKKIKDPNRIVKHNAPWAPPVDPSLLGEILGIPDAAKLLGVSVYSIRYMIRMNRIPTMQVGKRYKFLKSVLMEWLKNGMTATVK